LGQLLCKIESLGLYENSAIIFMSDHGHYIGDHGRIGKSGSGPDGPWPFYQEVAHIPFLVKIPDGNLVRSDFLMQPVDVMTTVLDLANAPIPEGVQGKSLVPIIRDGSVQERPVAVTSRNLVDDPDRGGCSSITDGQWTLHYRGPNHPAELYHLTEDPKEENNLYDSSRSVAERLHTTYLDLLNDAGTSQKRIELRSELP